MHMLEFVDGVREKVGLSPRKLLQYRVSKT